MIIEAIDESEFSEQQIDIAQLKAISDYVGERLYLDPGTELSLLIVDEERMSELHVEWMDEPGPTDVLSFPMDELTPGTEDRRTPVGHLGDIVLCPSFVRSQAAAAGNTVQQELLLLTVHGVLHLLGYDHAEPEEKAEMFGLQNALLADFYALGKTGEL